MGWGLHLFLNKFPYKFISVCSHTDTHTHTHTTKYTYPGEKSRMIYIVYKYMPKNSHRDQIRVGFISFSFA